MINSVLDKEGMPCQKYIMTGVDIDRLANGKVVECWPIADELSALQQLGVVPRPEKVRR